MTSAKRVMRRAWPVLLSYGLFSMWGIGCLFASIALTGKTARSFGPDAFVAAIGILIATAAGHVTGNFLGLLRLRLFVVAVLFVALFFASTMLTAALGGLGAFLIIAVVAALSGYLGIASRLDVVAAWFPLSLSVSAAILWMNAHDAIKTFNAGNKYALWDAFSLVCLTGAVFLLLVFLATRHAFGLSVWQDASEPAGIPSGARAAREVGVRPGKGSLLVLFVFTIVVLGIAAAISPYLFRTVKTDKGQAGQTQGKDQGKEKGQTQKGKGKGNGTANGTGSGSGTGTGTTGTGDSQSGSQSGSQGSQSRSSGSRSGSQGSQQGSSGSQSGSQGSSSGDQGSSSQQSGSSGSSSASNDSNDESSSESSSEQSSNPSENDEAVERAKQSSSEALSLGLELMKWFLLAALIAVVLGLIGVPPAKRAFLLRHLERPLWPVAPTSRVMNLWRRALAVLGDAGILQAAGETPSEFASRAERELRETYGCHAEGLTHAAAIVEKIDYAGRGLGAEDEATMRTIVMRFVATVTPAVPFGKRFAAAWTRSPEVES